MHRVFLNLQLGNVKLGRAGCGAAGLLLLCAACNVCRSPCDSFRQCDDADFDTQLNDWAAEADLECDTDSQFLVVGECEAGPVFLRRGNGFTSLTNYYERETGAFLGFVSTFDVIGPPCWGSTYGPREIACANPQVTELLCPGRFEEGSGIFLP